MINNKTYIEAKNLDTSRPKNRPPKNNWSIELIKKLLRIIQHVSPFLAARIIWHFFTKPGEARFSKSQEAILKKAKVEKLNYKGFDINAYRWGETGPKVLLAHGWRSKIADFRKMIEALVESGYVVEGVDMKAHGRSSGKHTGLPEFRDILKSYYQDNAPFEALVGYSMGGIASGITLSELSYELQPKQLFLIAAPPHVRYFFKSAVIDIGCNMKVYDRLCALTEKKFGETVDYFDLRTKTTVLSRSNIHLIYDEDDQLVPFKYGDELMLKLDNAHFVHTKGIGHYKVIAYPEIINYLIESLKRVEHVLVPNG